MGYLREYGIRGPIEPKHSCPDIDSIINELEDVRKINDELRSGWGDWEEIAEQLAEDKKKLEEENDRLRVEVDNLKEEVQILASE